MNGWIDQAPHWLLMLGGGGMALVFSYIVLRVVLEHGKRWMTVQFQTTFRPLRKAELDEAFREHEVKEREMATAQLSKFEAVVDGYRMQVQADIDTARRIAVGVAKDYQTVLQSLRDLDQRLRKLESQNGSKEGV